MTRMVKYCLVDVDLGLRRTLPGNKAMDVGDALENIVVRLDETEVIFVARAGVSRSRSNGERLRRTRNHERGSSGMVSSFVIFFGP